MEVLQRIAALTWVTRSSSRVSVVEVLCKIYKWS